MTDRNMHAFERHLAAASGEMAREAGRLLARRHLSRYRKKFRIETKGTEIDLVTDVDRKADKLIVSRIKRLFPTHGIVSEEGGTKTGGGDYTWIIDPIDGTTNFVHGYPFFAVSIGIEHDGEMIVGCVYDPLRDEMFSARKGKGARLNGRRIAVSETSRLDRSLLATGFPYDVKNGGENNIDYWERFLLEARALRRDGSAALDLCYVAAGRFDGFWELKLKPWDLAAGLLMVAEAGGKTSDFKGRPASIYSREILADNGLLHNPMLKVLDSTGTVPRKGAR
jgi:myo-inositol-1(or 4)-monophosphatase